jgi:hypothetical protein
MKRINMVIVGILKLNKNKIIIMVIMDGMIIIIIIMDGVVIIIIIIMMIMDGKKI